MAVKGMMVMIAMVVRRIVMTVHTGLHWAYGTMTVWEQQSLSRV